MLRRQALETLTGFAACAWVSGPATASVVAGGAISQNHLAAVSQVLEQQRHLHGVHAVQLRDTVALCRTAGQLQDTARSAGPAFWQSVCDSLSRVSAMAEAGQLRLSSTSSPESREILSAAARCADSQLRQALCS